MSGGEQDLKCHGFDGTTCQVRVDDATSVADVSRSIASKVCVAPGSLLVLLSGSNVLVGSRAILGQVTGKDKEVSYCGCPAACRH